MRFLTATLVMTVLAGFVRSEEPAYRLGPGDRIAISLDDLKEVEMKPSSVSPDGTVEFQYTGSIPAAGLTCQQLAQQVKQRISAIIRDPRVRCEVVEYGSQPVSILGAVNKPGIHQIRGSKTLVEVLALGEGLKLEAGNVIKITRVKLSGPLPLPGARSGVTGDFTTGEVNVKALLEARTPELNIPIRPHDIISVPRADLIYVMGNVRKPGGFPLVERESMTVLQALALAEGVDPLAAAQSSRVIRSASGDGPRTEVRVDVRKILAGKLPDQPLQPNDILFVPSSRSKSAGMRALEAGIQLGTGIAIFRR